MLSVLLSQSTTTTVTISNTVETGGIDRPGINLGGVGRLWFPAAFEVAELCERRVFSGRVCGSDLPCSSGGSNTTTTWYNSITDASGFPANFWAGASFVAINAATGTSYGSGVVTASTSNTGTTGITFTLSPALSAACNPIAERCVDRAPNGSHQSACSQPVAERLFRRELGYFRHLSLVEQHAAQSPDANRMRSTFYIDATVTNRTNTNASLATQQVNFINLNGSYNATFKAKCAVTGCSVTFSLGRFGGHDLRR